MNPLTRSIILAFDLSPGWLPQTAIELLFILLGSFMGFVFVFVGWKGSATKTFDRNHPIVKGFLYGLVGVLATLMADWKALFGSSVDKARLVTFYGIPYVIVGFGGVLAIGFGIWIKFVWLRRDKI